jgi:hypothetical protein
MTSTQNLTQDLISSPLVNEYLEQESRWRNFLSQHFPDARLLRWSPEHRVFRRDHRVLKIEWAGAANRDPRLNFEYEYSLMSTLEGRVLRLNPSYRVIDGLWYAIEMDWIEGDYLSELIREGRGRSVSAMQLVYKLFLVSLSGVVYKQFRARHIIRRPNGELVFIDFGHSSRATPLVALWRNFALRSYRNGSWQWGRLIGILREMRRNRESSTTQKRNATAIRRWQSNAHRVLKELPEHLLDDPGDPIAARHFSTMERCLSEAVKIEPRISDDLFQFRFGNYCIYGNRDWGFIWDHIARRVDFTGKRIADLGCGMGSIGAFSRIAGGAHATSLDSQPLLLDSARYLAAAVGIEGNEYRNLDWSKLADGSEVLPKADIISALSVRFADLPFARVLDILAQYPEIIWQTSCVDKGRRGLEARGYRTVETIVKADTGQYILYAVDRRG